MKSWGCPGVGIVPTMGEFLSPCHNNAPARKHGYSPAVFFFFLRKPTLQFLPGIQLLGPSHYIIGFESETTLLFELPEIKSSPVTARLPKAAIVYQIFMTCCGNKLSLRRSSVPFATRWPSLCCRDFALEYQCLNQL